MALNGNFSIPYLSKSWMVQTIFKVQKRIVHDMNNKPEMTAEIRSGLVGYYRNRPFIKTASNL
jgi:hypothetical protein